MYRILRQLTPEELRQAAAHCGARVCATPEEVIRCLSRLCGAFNWGIFPANTPDVLLDHVGQSLGMAPMDRGPQALPLRERAILAAYLRQAWTSADPERRRAALSLALAAWDNSTLPRPEFLVYPDDAGWNAVPEPLLQHSTGCRALAVALETHPLSLPDPALRGGPMRVGVLRRTDGHVAMFGVLLVLWRARARLLRERRVQRAELGRQLQQMESLLTVRSKHLAAGGSSWSRNPQSGLALTAAAGLSAAVHLALAAGPMYLIPAGVVGAAGLAWSAAAAASGPRRVTDQRVQKLNAQLHALRHQLIAVERDILMLEAE